MPHDDSGREAVDMGRPVRSEHEQPGLHRIGSAGCGLREPGTERGLQLFPELRPVELGQGSGIVVEGRGRGSQQDAPETPHRDVVLGAQQLLRERARGRGLERIEEARQLGRTHHARQAQLPEPFAIPIVRGTVLDGLREHPARGPHHSRLDETPRRRDPVDALEVVARGDPAQQGP